MHFLLRLVAGAIALYLTVLAGQILGLGLSVAPGARGGDAVIIAALVLGAANAIVRPVALFLALPITCLTFGLFGFVVNAALFWLVGQYVPGFHVRGFVGALFGSVVMGLVSAVLNMFIGRKSRVGARGSK